ncbi:MAG: phosphoglucosamine mutase [Acidobacteriota bacterium]
MSEALFGTDGIRGVALQPPLDAATLGRLGLALAGELAAAGQPLRILLAGDTRASTEVLASWVGGGFRAAGGELQWAGVLPTPAISHLLREDGGYGAGVIVSASHNPAADNGIKLVTGSGAKWPVAQERALERRLRGLAGEPTGDGLPAVDRSLGERYLDLLGRTLPPQPLAGMRLVADAANGAASPLAERFFAGLGADVVVISASPTGANINAGCGALYPQHLAREVVARGAEAGVAFDGDADRAILVTGTGRILDGDDVLYLWALALAEAGTLAGSTVVATVMSNLGLELALGAQGIRVVRCPVGDREVWEAMTREGAVLGGEQSGHVICAHHAVTGDGLLTAAHILAIARRRGSPLESLARLQRLPQVLRNVRVARRRRLEEVPALAAEIAAVRERFGEQGRVLVRYSGTEPLLRIMVEADTAEGALAAADDLVAAARKHLGSSEPGR